MADEIELKKRFARQILRGATPWDAICLVIPDYDERASERFTLSRDWAIDEEVHALKKQILEEDGDDALGLPTREELIKDLWADIQQATGKDKAALAKVYADVRGWTQKPTDLPTNQTNITHNVMVVKDHGSDEAWQLNAIEQQRKLVNSGNEAH